MPFDVRYFYFAMIQVVLSLLVIVTGIGCVAESYYERDIPWHFGKFFLLFVVILFVFSIL